MWIIVPVLCVASIAVALLPPAEAVEGEHLSIEDQASSNTALVVAACLIVACLAFLVSGIRHEEDGSSDRVSDHNRRYDRDH